MPMPKSKARKNIFIKDLLLSSSVSLTLSDRRLYNYLLHHAFEKLPKRLDFEIKLSELQGVYGTGIPPIDRLKESLRRLLRTLIEFETAQKNWVIISLLEKAELDEIDEQLYYSYPNDIRPLFTDPLTLERCLIQAHFTQKYSNLLYEILGHAHYSEESIVNIEISDLRSRLQIPGSKLINYSDFDRFVLTPATKEINSYASFAVKYHTQRKGMRVTHIIFEMANKRNIVLTESAQHIIPSKRPRLFIDDPNVERAYAYLLNSETKERRKFFDLACKFAAKRKQKINEEEFDRPDLWFRWVEDLLLKINDN